MDIVFIILLGIITFLLAYIAIFLKKNENILIPAKPTPAKVTEDKEKAKNTDEETERSRLVDEGIENIMSYSVKGQGLKVGDL